MKGVEWNPIFTFRKQSTRRSRKAAFLVGLWNEAKGKSPFKNALTENLSALISMIWFLGCVLWSPKWSRSVRGFVSWYEFTSWGRFRYGWRLQLQYDYCTMNVDWLVLRPSSFPSNVTFIRPKRESDGVWLSLLQTTASFTSPKKATQDPRGKNPSAQNPVRFPSKFSVL